MKDKIVEKVIDKFQSRSEVGIKKYGTTLERDDYDLEKWLEEAQSEAMDFALYIQATLERIKKDKEIAKLGNPPAAINGNERGRLFIFDR
jgi:hypothetical protein